MSKVRNKIRSIRRALAIRLLGRDITVLANADVSGVLLLHTGVLELGWNNAHVHPRDPSDGHGLRFINEPPPAPVAPAPNVVSFAPPLPVPPPLAVPPVLVQDQGSVDLTTVNPAPELAPLAGAGVVLA